MSAESRRNFVKKSLVASILAAQPTIMAGLVRASGGGDETTIDPGTTLDAWETTAPGTTAEATTADPWETTAATTGDPQTTEPNTNTTIDQWDTTATTAEPPTESTTEETTDFTYYTTDNKDILWDRRSHGASEDVHGEWRDNKQDAAKSLNDKLQDMKTTFSGGSFIDGSGRVDISGRNKIAGVYYYDTSGNPHQVHISTVEETTVGGVTKYRYSMTIPAGTILTAYYDGPKSIPPLP